MFIVNNTQTYCDKVIQSNLSSERAQATELRYNKLKEKHAELVANHAELLRKVGGFGGVVCLFACMCMLM